jgi:drug/metabolite transporter (DMT)-like permease
MDVMKYDPPQIPASIQRGLLRAGGFRLCIWFLLIGLIACIPLWVVVAWRGTEPGPVELLLRGLLGFCSFGIGIIAYLWIIARLGRLP